MIEKFRNELDLFINDYEFMEKEYENFKKIHQAYVMMKDLLDEMKDQGELDGYNVEEIFKGIKELESLGIH